MHKVYSNTGRCAFYQIINNFNALTLLTTTMSIIQFKLLALNIKFNIDGIRLFTLHLNETSSFEAEAIVR